ncbi:hydroxyisourate hydrolase [Novosphingobium lindaniclasticum]
MTKLKYAAAFTFAALSPNIAHASEISTHVLDLARGVGGAGVPVVLYKSEGGGKWSEAGRAQTDENGRVRSFGASADHAPGVYKLQFDMSKYPSVGAEPFFPEIDLVFRVTDAQGHYHVPVVVSPFGYSTYRGN